jgi:putative component of toxin-antitoxin plasmid stabilization module
VYYARNGKTVVLLPCGADKRSQEAGIGRAVDCWKDCQRRNAP